MLSILLSLLSPNLINITGNFEVKNSHASEFTVLGKKYP
jgi:hypothetical protein